MKNTKFVPVLLLVLISSFRFPGFDRESYYKVLGSHSEQSIDKEIEKLGKAKKSAQNNAYSGTILMKKAEFLKGVNNKIKVFKKGARLLEMEIENSPENVEYRFLRLAIQEHAPKILKYNKNLEEDKRVVISGFEKLEPDLKKIIKNYSADSGVIKKEYLR